jgi:succinate dehydrogenase / fumarate reductase flavoprotein subunit
MERLVGIYRVQSELEQAVEELARLRARAAAVRVEGSRMFNPGWHLSRDLANMIVVSEAIARSAALRKESRGAHSRLDFTGTDAALGQVNFCATRGPDGMRVAPTPLPQMPAELKVLFELKAAQPAGAAR